MIYPASAKGPFLVPGYHDPDSVRWWVAVFRPPVWAAETVYYLRDDDDPDTVIAPTFNGCYYKVIQPGISGALEPATWTTVPGETVESGSVIFECVAYNLMPADETLTASSWAASDGVTISNETFTATSATVRIDAVPDGVKNFTLTHTGTRSNTAAPEHSFKFKVADR